MKTPGPLKLSLCLYARYLCSRDAIGQHIFGPKSLFAILLSTIIPKPLLIDSTVNNTFREVYLRSLAYRTENAPEALYYSVEYAVLLVIYNLMFVVITINSMLGLC